MEADVIVIGSGQAGVPLGVRLAKAGRRVVLFERGELGGTCVNDGCTPTKTMIASARAAHVARDAGRLGVRTGEVTVDFRAVVARKDAIVERWRDGVRRRLEEVEDRLELVTGHARFVGPHHVECAGRRFGAEVIVVNTGAAAAVPPIPGLQALEFLNNESAMQLGALPRHLLIAGGGYIGCEFSQMFRRFGAEVTVVDRNPQLLSREDPEIASALKSALEGEGVRLLLGRSIRRVDKDGGEIVAQLSDGSSARGSHLMLAAGRRPNTADLGCELAGIALDERGFIVVGDGYESSVPGIYAVGDVTGGPQFTHSSWDDHRILFDRLLERGQRSRADRIVPSVVFTDPQVARVGLTEREARTRGLQFETASMPFGHIARAIETDETAGTMKLLIDAEAETIIGASLVGAEAGELIHVFVALMRARAGVRAIVDAEFVHPTFAEGLQTLVMRLPRFALS